MRHLLGQSRDEPGPSLKRRPEPHEPAEHGHLYPKHDGTGSGGPAGTQRVCHAGWARGDQGAGTGFVCRSASFSAEAGRDGVAGVSGLVPL